tara:strand:+ start:84492 stop:85055 length:564 start_codon:yes stop_codon:yes gene_type:complete
MKKIAITIENANRPYLDELLDLYANPGNHPNAFLVGPELSEAARRLTKFVVESSPPPDLPPGKSAWVTNEEEGFVMHVLSSALEKMPVAIEALGDLFDASMTLGPAILHEYFHKKNREGVGDDLAGESEAVAAQERAKQDLENRYKQEVESSNRMLRSVVKLSTNLDASGNRKYSNLVDKILYKMAD